MLSRRLALVCALITTESLVAIACGDSGSTSGAGDGGIPDASIADSSPQPEAAPEGMESSVEPEASMIDAPLIVDASTPDTSDDGDAAVVDATIVDATTVDATDGAPKDAPEDSALEAAVDAHSPGVDASDGLPSTTPCLKGGNALVVDGGAGSFWLTGSQTVSTGSTWAVSAQNDTGKYDGALVEVHLPGTVSTDPWWFVAFDTSNLSAPIQLGKVYTNAAPDSEVAGEPGLTIGYAQSCANGVGKFRVDELTATGNGSEDTLLTFTAAFSATCGSNLTPLEGCVHYGP